MKEKIPEMLAQEIRMQRIKGAQFAGYQAGEKVFQFDEVYDDQCIYRIYSMTKPVTAIAITILIERGLLSREDNVSNYLPEYGRLKISRSEGLQSSFTPLKISHLLNMTSGIVYPGEDSEGLQMQELFDGIRQQQQAGCGPVTREVVKEISKIPLAFEPGRAWRYGFSADVLGAVIETVAGCSLSEFFEREIFAPLEMEDTGFYVPERKQERFITLYKAGESGLEVDDSRHLGLTECLVPPAFESGGAWTYVNTLDTKS